MTTTDRRYDVLADIGSHRPDRDAPLDAVFDALADSQCRTLLGHLAECDDDRVGVEDLAAHIADADDPRSLVAHLHHVLLPKLADAGFLDYDTDRGAVRYRPDARLDAVLSTVESEVDDAPAVSPTALFDALGDVRRRHALVTLLTHGDLSLPDLADEVAVAEHDDHLPEIDPDAVLQVYLSLYHTHVPKLSDVGLVEYDQERDFVTLTDTGHALESTVRSLCDPNTEPDAPSDSNADVSSNAASDVTPDTAE